MTRHLRVGELRAHAQRVLDEVHIENVRLKRIQCDSRDELAAGPFDVSTDVRFGGRQVASGGVEAWIRYEVVAEVEGADEAPAWNLDFEFIVEFALDNPDREHATFSLLEINAFAFALGITHAHPYARELVQSISGRLGYPPFTLDLFIPPTAGPDDEIIHFALPLDGNEEAPE